MDKLFTDFDNCIVNASQAFCSQYNRTYRHRKNFTPADWTKVTNYNFSCQCPLIKSHQEVEEIFGLKSFFHGLEFMEGAYEVLRELNEKRQIIICSIGTYDNISLKSKWIRDNLSFIKDSIFLVKQNCVMNKSMVNMQGGIFLDDVASNLISSNAERKILFGQRHSWNTDFYGEQCATWMQVKDRLL